jgi:hypothetical protein
MLVGASFTCNVISYKVMSGEYQVTVVPPAQPDYLSSIEADSNSHKQHAGK